MSVRLQSKLWLIVVAFALALVGCSSSDEGSPGPDIDEELDQNPPVSDLDSLIDGAPSNDKLPELGKADAVYPVKFTDLVALQSPVKSQGRRGVCSIFSTVGLMEHLYIAEGTITDPDFSEQDLQYVAKLKLGTFPKTSGSNASSNLRAINRFGVLEESAWPYEPSQWDEDDDPACDGSDEQPTRCYTNGEPPDSTASATRWYLPSGRWVNSKVRSLKAHMTSKRTAVVVGMDFYYQAWNHGGSPLKTDKELYKGGYVTYPNAKDKEESLKKRAGHSILIVGWDDEATAPVRDENGDPVLGDDGEPAIEKGFFIFKNSWGTGSFGKTNPYGPGFGYLSYRYVEEYGRAYVSSLPEVELPAEVCGDEIDNDRDGDVDCDDADCADDAACAPASGTLTFAGPASDIPDNDPAGTTSDIVVSDTGEIAAIKVSVDISHTYQSDLRVRLVKGGTEVVLHDRAGGSADDIVESWGVTQFNGADAAGTWTLAVSDHAGADTGRINSWTLEITTCAGGSCTTNATTYENTDPVAIPDSDPTGASSDITIADGGAITALTVGVDITHPYKGDLTIKLQKLTVGEAVLLTADASDGPFGTRTFEVGDFLGEDAAGTWRLVVVDEASGDVGTLESWSMTVSR